MKMKQEELEKHRRLRHFPAPGEKSQSAFRQNSAGLAQLVEQLVYTQ